MDRIRKKIIEKSQELGFDFCGMAPAEALLSEGGHFIENVSKPGYLELKYLWRNAKQRTDPRMVMPETKTVIAVLMNYYTKRPPDDGNFIISKYAKGDDYHEIINSRLSVLVDFIKNECGSRETRAYVDSAPVMEKAWASRCGLGWQGKHTILINPKKGSFFFIGVMLTDLELEADKPVTDHCGNCTKCIDACPTEALTPYNLDPSRCIACLTIEKVDNIEPELYEKFNNRIFGCDICQEACPYNKFAAQSANSAFVPNPKIERMSREDWMNITKDEFEEIFAHSPVKRTGYERFKNTIIQVDRYSPHR